MGKPVYHFDRWAEFLTVTLAENIARCVISQSPLQKIRVQLDEGSIWPVGYKAILENGLVARQTNQKTWAKDASVNSLEYFYRCPTQLPRHKDDTDTVAEQFIPSALKWDDAFYSDAWSLKMDDCIPALLRRLALRNLTTMLRQQLRHQGVDLSEDFSVQFYDGENYLSFFYDSLVADVKRQISFYLGDERVLNEAASLCFKHDENKKWFKSLAE